MITSGFASAVYIERVAGLFRLIWSALDSVEDEVAADLEQQSLLFTKSASKGLRCPGIHGVGKLGL